MRLFNLEPNRPLLLPLPFLKGEGRGEVGTLYINWSQLERNLE
jgi:hypothetical protein